MSPLTSDRKVNGWDKRGTRKREWEKSPGNRRGHSSVQTKQHLALLIKKTV